MVEAVRLVIWDLDETFWRGTLTEGGITAYVQAHHDLVIELARRGIMSSICSKNDYDTVVRVLQDRGILDYFIFPSISWAPKGPRLAQLVETSNLRPPTVMFVDDNPGNRAEAAAMVPGIQVETEAFIPRMLDDPRFVGKDDSALTRLRQYKLLEQRKRDEAQVSGSNEDFLRSCDIRVLIEYDVESHLDRAVELINRTNQLNYTKRRLPEDLEDAREELRRLLRRHDRAAGLVRVVDNYGDYGFVGFYLLHTGPREFGGGGTSSLEHFCFSCRTLGMLVEHWVYDFLGRPEITVVGEVLTDLSVPREIDWVRQVSALGDAATGRSIAPRIVLWGGCEMAALSVYLKPQAGAVEVFGPYTTNGVATAGNFAARVLDCWQDDRTAYLAEIERLGLPLALEAPDLVGDSAEGTVFVFNLAADAHGRDRLRHRRNDWSFCLAPEGMGWNALIETPAEELEAVLDGAGTLSEAQVRGLCRLAAHLRENYEHEHDPGIASAIADTRLLLELIPKGAKVVILTRHEEERAESDPKTMTTLRRVKDYKAQIAQLVAAYPFAATTSFSDAITSHDEILDVDHYAREVYLRVAHNIAATASALPARQDSPASKRRLTRLLAERQTHDRLLDQARDVIRASYETMLRRPAEPDMTAREAEVIASGRETAGWFVRAVAKSDEFASKWAKTEPGQAGRRDKLIGWPELRIPSDLALTPFHPRRAVLIGSCLTEGLRHWMRNQAQPCESDWYFVGTELPAQPPAPLDQYDLQIVQLSLRLILPDASFARLGQLDEAGHERLFQHALGGVQRHLEMAMRWNRQHGLLTVVLPFIEPVQNPVGRLMARYDLRNPMYFVQRLNEEIEHELGRYSNAYLLDLNGIFAHHGKRYTQEDVFMAFNHASFLSDFDASHDANRLEPAGRASEYYESRLEESFAAVWREILSLSRAVRQIDSVKLVVVDLDDTMWRGVMAEIEEGNLPTSEGWPLGIWEALLFLKRRGILLAILSKNEESRVLGMWERIFGSQLKPSDFAALKINWNPKAENIAQILADVSLLARNVVYVDDNPVERAAVKAAFPELRTLGGSPLLWRRVLLWSPETQPAVITKESASRTEMVRAQVDREEQRRSMSREEFLESLNVVLTLFEVDSTDHPRFARVLELVNKTNQFNTTGQRRTREEFVTLFGRGDTVLAFEVADRFTQYGLVGVVILEEGTISQFVMSCRVLGLGVEGAAVGTAMDYLAQRGASTVFGPMVHTDRNQPCRELYAQCGFEAVEGGWRRPVNPPLQRAPHLRTELQLAGHPQRVAAE